MGLRLEDVSNVCQKKKSNILGLSIDMPHKPANQNYEVLDDWLSKKTKQEALSARNWNRKQVQHIEDFFQEEKGEVVLREKKPKAQVIKELEEKARVSKLTAKERRALKNLRIKQRREAKKMKRVEKRLRRKR